MNYQSIEKRTKAIPEGNEFDDFPKLKIQIFIGEKVFMHNRKVYDSMQFLGDAGGIQGSMILIGQVLHFILSGNS